MRKFVTSVCLVVVMIVSLLNTLACQRAKTPKSVDPQEAKERAVKEGTNHLAKATLIKWELANNYEIRFLMMDATGRLLDGKRLARDYNWKRFTKAERHAVKEKIANLITLLSRVLELDAKQGIYLTMKEQVVQIRDEALAYQASLEAFEKLMGEQFDPKFPGGPAFNRIYEI